MRRSKRAVKTVFALLLIAPISACVTSGYEGQRGTTTTTDQLIGQRQASQQVRVFQTIPSGYSALGEVSVRRCHGNFFEKPPNAAVFQDDLVRVAFAKGADAIANIRTKRLNGLLADCWYVEEATATTYRLN